jgi:hypothetical protein
MKETKDSAPYQQAVFWGVREFLETLRLVIAI